MSSRPLPSDVRPPSDFETEIRPLRDQIDAIDAQLLSLLNARAAVVTDIYALKARHGVTRFDSARNRCNTRPPRRGKLRSALRR